MDEENGEFYSYRDYNSYDGILFSNTKEWIPETMWVSLPGMC